MVMRSFLILTIVSALFFVLSCTKAAEPLGIQKAANTATANNTRAANPDAHDDHAEDNAPRITLAEAKKAFDAGEVVFIDTRDPNAYKQEHLKGAMNITNAMLGSQYESIPKDKKIIAYCS